MKRKDVVTCIIKNKDKILLIKRGSTAPTYSNKWSFVCGVIEQKEKPLETALREIQEETEITQNKIKFLKQEELFVLEDKEIDVTWHIIPFLFESIVDEVTLDWENTEYVWVKPEELLNYYLVPGIIQVALRLMDNLVIHRRGILAILYKDSNLFVTVKTINDNVTFVSGQIEKNESEEDAVIREVREESGIEIERNQIKKLPLVNKFTYSKGFLKGVKGSQNVYLAKVDEHVKVKFDGKEIVDAKWMTKDEVRKNLTFEHIKKIFEKSLEYIK